MRSNYRGERTRVGESGASAAEQPYFEIRPHNMKKYAAVVIGRNEGERLKRCLASLSTADRIVYVDSGSSDGSVQWARNNDVDVVELDMSAPFTAARARNAGYRRLQEVTNGIPYVQFVDGDCEIIADWPSRAIMFLSSNAEVGVVCGHLRELFPERSVYNWMCQEEWNGPVGAVRACGGNMMVRASAFEAVGGYRDKVIAAEDDELCLRLRVAGWLIWRLDAEMAGHDAAMLHFGQWWRRALRCGYAYAQGAHLHGAGPERHFVWESRRALIWGLYLPLTCLAAGLVFGPPGWLAFSIYPLQVTRQVVRNSGSLRRRTTLALFELIGRFPEALGQLKFQRDLRLAHAPQLIEYK